MPEFYSHVGYVDDQGMPLPSLDEGSDDISFQSVDDHSLSPDSAFDYLSSEEATVQWCSSEEATVQWCSTSLVRRLLYNSVLPL